MLSFPVPYPNELLYSAIARAGVHDGETSPKQLLDSVFDNRKVIATVDLPGHVQKVANQYPESLGLDVKALIDGHSLWPIYAPFVPPYRRSDIEAWMRGVSRGAAHLASGVAASRIKSKQKLVLCPECVKEQERAYGEAYWDRRWLVPQVHCCPKHGPLYQTNIKVSGEHRHAFIAVSDAKVENPLEVTDSDVVFSNLLNRFIQGFPFQSPDYEQWTLFYRDLAVEFGYLCEKQIDHQKIRTQFCAFWGEAWLRRINLFPSKKETSWLQGIFRKHRKSFSFAEHITVIKALSDGNIEMAEAIKSALEYPVSLKEKIVIVDSMADAAHQDQVQWLALLEGNGPKRARQLSPALYARLYRKHYHWLININSEHRATKVYVNNRVDWQQRDRESARVLLESARQFAKDLTAPRLTRNYLLHQLQNWQTVEKNLFRLSRCRAVLIKYSESVAAYQSRRLARAEIQFRESDQPLKRWSLLRSAGLSEERITESASEKLGEILKGDT